MSGLVSVWLMPWLGCVQAPTEPAPLIDPNLEPETRLLSPAEGEVFDLWAPVRFDAYVQGMDRPSACCDESFVWAVGEKVLGELPTLTVDDLPLGDHEITLTVTDAEGSQWQETVRITVAFTSPLAWWENGEIMLFDGERTEPVAEGFDPAFTPDGSQLLYAADTGKSTDLAILDLDSGVETLLTDDVEADAQPTVSPDGSEVAWIRREGGDIQLWVADLDGARARQAVFLGVDVYEPHWSHAGIVFRTQTPVTALVRKELYVLRSLGDLPERIADGDPWLDYPHWTDGGRFLLASRSEGRNLHIVRMNPDGSGVEPVIADAGFHQNASLSPNGTKIVFTSDREGGLDLYVSRLDGSEIVRLPLDLEPGVPRLRPVWRP